MDLKDFHISKEVGFLLEDPLEFLPPYYDSWLQVAKSLPELMEEHRFRERVLQMPLLDHTKLVGHRQKRLAQLQLSVIAMGYVWQEGQVDVPSRLPTCLAVPLWAISEDIGIPAIGGHANIFLANWQRKDPNGSVAFEFYFMYPGAALNCTKNHLQNMRCLYSFPGGLDTDNFFGLTCAMEADFVPALKAILAGVECISQRDESGLMEAFSTIHASLEEMIKTFSKFHVLTNSEVFFKKLLPCFGGYGGEKSPIPDGMIFEGVSETPVKLMGDTGAQTSTIPCLDAFLNVTHDPGQYEFLMNCRNYMPPDHKRFIEELEKLPSTRKFVEETSNDILKKAYDDCLQVLVKFRNCHIQSVTKYLIIQQIKKEKEDEGNKNVDSGERYPLPFLKQLRNETLDHKYN